MNILITGGFGYLGGRISKYLSENGNYNILIASRSPHENIKLSTNSKKVKIDWSSNLSLDHLTSQVDIVIHAAGMNSDNCIKNPLDALRVNGMATGRLIQSAIRQKVKRFMYISTAHVYNSPLIGEITEKSDLNNTHPYATSHRAGEDILKFAHQNRNIEGVIIRLSNAYGAPINKNVDCWMLLVNDLCRQAITNKCMILKSSGLQFRDFVTISDTCSAVRHLIKIPLQMLENGIFNVGGSVKRVIDMAHIIQKRCVKLLGFKPEITSQKSKHNETNLLNYSIDKLLDTSFTLNNDVHDEIDSTLLFCKKFFQNTS